MAKYKITQDYIAKELNISRKTVSKVFNNVPGIKDDTRKMVLEKAKELGYSHINPDIFHPSPDVNHSPDNKALNIAFVCYSESFWGSYWTSILSGLENTLRKNNANLKFITVSHTKHASISIPPSLTAANADAMVIAGVFSNEYYKKLKSLNIPMVSLDTSIGLSSVNKICDIVMVENVSAIHKITLHLIEKGHRDLCFIGDIYSCLSFYERWQGFQTAMSKYSLSADEGSHLTGHSPSKYYNCSEIINKLNKLDKKPTAFVCANDTIAIVLMALKKPPYQYLSEDTIITGFDNISEYSVMLSGCSTVEIYPEDIGQSIADLVLWRLQNSNRQFRTVRLNVKTILR